MDHIQFRLFTIADYDALLALWQAAALDHRPSGRDSREAMARETLRASAHILLAELQGRVIGSVLASHDGRRGWINRLAVHPDFRHRGLARQLTTRAESWLKDQGLGILVCLIEEENHSSRALFQSMNYVEHGDIIYYSKRLRSDI